MQACSELEGQCKHAIQYSTGDSHVVPQRTTSPAQRSLCSLIGREGQLSPWYDRTMVGSLVDAAYMCSPGPHAKQKPLHTAKSGPASQHCSQAARGLTATAG